MNKIQRGGARTRATLSVKDRNARFIGNTRIDAAAELCLEFLGNEMGIQAVPNNLWTNKDDQFRAVHGIVLMRERVAEARNGIEYGDSVPTEVMRFTYQSGKQNRLSVGDRNRALHPSLRDRRGQTGRGLRRYVADL